MRLTTYLASGVPRLALVEGDELLDFSLATDGSPVDLRRALAEDADPAAIAARLRAARAPRRHK